MSGIKVIKTKLLERKRFQKIGLTIVLELKVYQSYSFRTTREWINVAWKHSL